MHVAVHSLSGCPEVLLGVECCSVGFGESPEENPKHHLHSYFEALYLSFCWLGNNSCNLFPSLIGE